MNAYPLQWPIGRPRTPASQIERSRFRNGSGVRALVTVDGALSRLLPELRLLGAASIVVSSNVPTRMHDGMPRTLRAEPLDRGVAVYFRHKREPRALCCDRWDRVADNIAAIAAHVDAVRGILRWGTADAAQMFAGFKALAAADAKKPWWEILGFRERPSNADVVKDKWRELASLHHPDRGGNVNQMAELNAAWNEARIELDAV